MKVTFPLSLKISLWLLLNFLLLGAAAVVALLSQGGFGWNSLIRGPAGERLMPLAQSIMAEVGAADPGQRNTTLAAFEKKYGASFALFDYGGRQLGGEPLTLPPAVADRLTSVPPPRGGPRPDFGPGGGPIQGPGGPGGPGARSGPDRPLLPRDLPPDRGMEEGRGRFYERSSDPTLHWLGVRTRLLGMGRPLPVTLIIRVPSTWVLFRILDLQTWFWAASTVFALSVLFWLPLVRGITQALRRLTAATEQIAEGRFETRVAAGRRDELGHLGESINSMAARLDTLVNGQKRFLGDVAHELGSPLGRLQVALEILESRTDPSLAAHVSDVREEVQQMTTLVNELLAFTKAGLRARTAELESLDLPPLIADVVAREGGTARIAVAVPPQLKVRGDAPLLARALGNLIRNAVRYAGDLEPIVVDARVDGDWVKISVDDHGPGVSPEALSRLGEPFYRPEAARTRETGGVGLGLAIVRSAVTACGGEVHFANRTPHGFHAEIRLAAG
ncbi:MAG: HAMP domain-containing histidine kinase [Opitutaceae bacterium]|nr:HAMP domain-containing histidine kinase [Opitutaceae bacterium]